MSSFRAGGIHWAATMDANGFAAGARRVKTEATRLQQDLRNIQSQFKDSPFAQRALSDRAMKNEMAREAERLRFQKASSDGLAKTIADMAAFERQSVAMAATAKRSFGSVGDSISALFGKQGGMAQFAALAKGGGALMGINLVTDSVGRLAAEATALRTAMGSGNWTAGQKTEGFIAAGMKSVPIFDKIFDSGGKIYDLFDSMANGKPFAQLAEDARRTEANIKGMRDAMEEFARGIRDVRGQKPLDAINDELDAARKRIIEQRTAGLFPGISETDERQLFKSSNEAIAMAERRAAEKRLALQERESGWDPLSGVKGAFGRASNQFGNVRRLVENSFTGMLFDREKRIDEATKKWKDRLTTFGKTLLHGWEELEAKRDAFNDAARKKRNERDDFINDVLGIADNLRDQQNAPVRFASALERGTQDEFASRMQLVFKGANGNKSEAQLLTEAIRILREQKEEAKRRGDEALRILSGLGVANF